MASKIFRYPRRGAHWQTGRNELVLDSTHRFVRAWNSRGTFLSSAKLTTVRRNTERPVSVDLETSVQYKPYLIYQNHHTEEFRIPYSLTIVNTTGYSGSCDLDADREITEVIRKFVFAPDGIQQLDMIGFVAQSFLPRQLDMQTHIFKSVKSIFGKSIKNKVNLLITFADSHVPPILELIAEAGMPFPADCRTGQLVQHKFNNSGLFCSNGQSSSGGSSIAVDKFSRSCWRMGMDNFRNFLSVIDSMKSLSSKWFDVTNFVFNYYKTELRWQFFNEKNWWFLWYLIVERKIINTTVSLTEIAVRSMIN